MKLRFFFLEAADVFKTCCKFMISKLVKNITYHTIRKNGGGHFQFCSSTLCGVAFPSDA